MIDNKTYRLDESNYNKSETKKTKIILGHTYNNNMKHFIGWKHRNYGKYKKTAAFTISKEGVIYQHFDPKYTSNYFKNSDLNSKSILILLENEGYLVKDNDKYFNWVGEEYTNKNNIFEKKWRGFSFWPKYTDEQLNSAIKLVKKLCNDFNIPLKSINHNTKVEYLGVFNGVFYKSNLAKHYKDLSPCWDFEIFKRKVEQND